MGVGIGIGDLGFGIRDWGFGIGDWGLGLGIGIRYLELGFGIRIENWNGDLIGQFLRYW